MIFTFIPCGGVVRYLSDITNESKKSKHMTHLFLYNLTLCIYFLCPVFQKYSHFFPYVFSAGCHKQARPALMFCLFGTTFPFWISAHCRKPLPESPHTQTESQNPAKIQTSIYAGVHQSPKFGDFLAFLFCLTWLFPLTRSNLGSHDEVTNTRALKKVEEKRRICQDNVQEHMIYIYIYNHFLRL